MNTTNSVQRSNSNAPIRNGFSALEVTVGPARSKSILKSDEIANRVELKSILSQVVSTENDQVSENLSIEMPLNIAPLTMTKQNAYIERNRSDDRLNLTIQGSSEDQLTPVEKLNKYIEELQPYDGSEEMNFGSRLARNDILKKIFVLMQSMLQPDKGYGQKNDQQLFSGLSLLRRQNVNGNLGLLSSSGPDQILVSA